MPKSFCPIVPGRCTGLLIFLAIALCLGGCAGDRNQIFNEAGYIRHTAGLEEQKARKLYEEKRLSEVERLRQEKKARLDARFLEREKGGDGVPRIEMLDVDELIEKLDLQPGSQDEERIRAVLEEYVAARTGIIEKYKAEEEKPEAKDLKTEVQNLVKDMTSGLEDSLDKRKMRQLQFVLGSQIVPIQEEIFGKEDELRPGQGIYGKLVDDPEKGSKMGGAGSLEAGMGQLLRSAGGGRRGRGR